MHLWPMGEGRGEGDGPAAHVEGRAFGPWGGEGRTLSPPVRPFPLLLQRLPRQVAPICAVSSLLSVSGHAHSLRSGTTHSTPTTPSVVE